VPQSTRTTRIQRQPQHRPAHLKIRHPFLGGVSAYHPPKKNASWVN
jgi:hypothetical protein